MDQPIEPNWTKARTFLPVCSRGLAQTIRVSRVRGDKQSSGVLLPVPSCQIIRTTPVPFPRPENNGFSTQYELLVRIILVEAGGNGSVNFDIDPDIEKPIPTTMVPSGSA